MQGILICGWLSLLTLELHTQLLARIDLADTAPAAADVDQEADDEADSAGPLTLAIDLGDGEGEATADAAATPPPATEQAALPAA